MPFLRQTSTPATSTRTLPPGSETTPGLAAFLKALRQGDTLVVWKLDRLGRDPRHLVNTCASAGPRPLLAATGVTEIPYLTAWANSGKSWREQALRLMAIRQARLEPLALMASGRERMFNGWAAASGEKRIDLSERIAWFCDILNIEGSFVEIGPRSVFRNSAVGVR